MPQSGETPRQMRFDRDFYWSLFNHSPFPTLVLDPNMVVLEVNQVFLERYGLRRNQVIGRYCYQVFHDRREPCPREQCQFPDALSGRLNCINLHDYLNPYGEQVVEEVHLTPLTDQQGNIWGILESVRDITQAKRLQATLMEANEFLNRILDSLVGVVVAADLEGKILFVNQSVKRVLGYEVSELVGKHLSAITGKDEIRRLAQALEENQGRALFVRTYVKSKDGEKIPVRTNSSYVYREGKPVATVSIFTDLRERLKMEEQVIKARMQVVQSDKLAGLGRMAAGVAHELNNPLTGILVYAELLKDSLPPDDPAQDDLACIIEDAERCQEIVRGMLEYSRQGEVRVEELDLSQLVEDAFTLIRDNAVFLNVTIKRNYHPEPLVVHGDRKLLRQVFINLLMNAVDAMEGQGTLTVTTGLDDEGWRYAEVSDTGPGIPEEHLSRVFDPFFTTKPVGKGTGLGLSVVYGVMERHGGEIKVKETGPQGTTFLVRLPPQAPPELMALAEVYNPQETDSQDRKKK